MAHKHSTKHFNEMLKGTRYTVTCYHGVNGKVYRINNDYLPLTPYQNGAEMEVFIKKIVSQEIYFNYYHHRWQLTNGG